MLWGDTSLVLRGQYALARVLPVLWEEWVPVSGARVLPVLPSLDLHEVHGPELRTA